MKPLPTSQRVMTWFCMCPAHESTTTTKRMCYAAFTFFFAVIFLQSLVEDAMFITKNITTNFEKCLYAVFQFSAHTSMLNLIIIGVINRHRIAAIFTELSKLYAANENAASFKFFLEANGKSEFMWNVFFKFVLGGFFLNVVISAITSIIYCFHNYGVFNADHLYKPFILSVPWDQSTPFGYFAEIVFSLIHGECYLLCDGTILILFASMCWHHQAFYKRFRYSASKLYQPDIKQNVNGILRDLIRFHISVKNWFLQSAGVYSTFVLIHLICNVIFSSAVVFELDLRMRKIDFEMFLLLNAIPIGVLNLYIYCYFGQLATESYEKMAECLYESNWQMLSLDLQKKILLVILNMQQTVFYHGFGVAVLNLQSFIKFFKAIFTYYMMFKTLTE